MNADQLLTHFDRISEAPDAITRLRRFILDLAVRGKLVEQDPWDEPAAAQLSLSDRMRQMTAKEDYRASTDIQTLLAAEERWNVPSTWEWRALADLVLFIDYRGQTPIKVDNGVRLITAKNVKKGFINPAPEEFLSKENYHRWMTRGLPKEGDVLFTTEAPMGNAAVVQLPERFALAQRVICFRNYGAVNPDFLVLQLIGEPFQAILNKTATGLTAKGIKAAKLKRLPVVVPPLVEQQRIVAKVDELMALCDRLEAAQTEREGRRDRLASAVHASVSNSTFLINHLPHVTICPEHIHHLRQTILNLAVRGQLVPQDPNDEPVAELLKRIQAEKVRRLKSDELRKQPVLPDTPDNEAPFGILYSWRWIRMDDCFNVGGGIQKTPARTPRDNSYPYIGVGNVYRGRLDLYEVKHFELIEGELERFRLIKGDILVVEGNGSANEIGRCARWAGEIEECVHQNHIIRCRPFNLHLTPYVLKYLNSPSGIEVMKALAVTSSGLYNLSVGKIRTIQIPLPPLAEQDRIVAKVDELMTLCDQLESQLTTTQTESRRLLEAVLHEALGRQKGKENESPDRARLAAT